MTSDDQPPDDRAPPRPAVPISESVTPNFLICLETGLRLVLLRRHITQRLRLTPEQYREKWGLPAEYPMAAPNYACRRNRSLPMDTTKKS